MRANVPKNAAPRVLLLYLQTTGAGHKAAADAIGAAVHARTPHARVESLNIADFMGDPVRESYHKVRALLIREAPHVIGQLYQWSDGPRDEPTLLDQAITAVERAAFGQLVEQLKSADWDVIVHTHFFPPTVLADLRESRQLHMPQLVVTTDFFTHGLWVHPKCERTFVATAEAKAYLEFLGVPSDQLRLTGIPVNPEFSRRRLNSTEHAEQTGARKVELASGERPRITLMTTGFSNELAAALLQHLVRSERPLSVLAVAGSSEERLAALNAIEIPSHHEVERIGFTREMPAILQRGDLLIGKAGGLTSSECLAMGCPIVVVNPTPDQEIQNTQWMLERGAAMTCFHPSLLPTKVDDLFAHPDRWADMRIASHQAGQPNAAFDVSEEVLAMIYGQAPEPEAHDQSNQERPLQ